jgi:hypothetical protein
VVTEYVVGFAADRAAGTRRPHRLEVRLRSKNTGTVMGGKRTVLY